MQTSMKTWKSKFQNWQQKTYRLENTDIIENN